MTTSESTDPRKRLGKIVRAVIIASALITGLLVINQTNRFPAPTTQKSLPTSLGLLRRLTVRLCNCQSRTTAS